ncbi:diacylglycerol kinase catalytic domain-containing protein [Sinorhizobium medicae]|uniref:hypothetical protein n=1 Tax=Sinorhizobium medicae TaxID=110321 RepID=UPI001F201A47|nr:hypothetical protein [Sinorhizobium medicae]
MKIAFRASPKPGAQRALHELSSRYGQTPAAEADFIVTLGGDGTALEALHEALAMPAKPVFAMRPTVLSDLSAIHFGRMI